MPVDAAVQKAVAECIHENILADFLRKNQAEVIAMSIFEYDKEEEEKKLRKAEFEAGVEHGIEQSLVSLVIRKEKKKICRRNCGYARRNSGKNSKYI